MLTVESIRELKGQGSILDSSINNFQNFLDQPWSGMPVEACYNEVSHTADNKGNLTSHPSFKTQQYLCMRFFNNNHKNPTDALMMKITNKSQRQPIIKDFYDFLLGKHSPWKNALDSMAIIRPDNHGIPDAIIWHDTINSDCRLAMSLFTALRLHTCWGIDILWHRLVDAGFTKRQSILLCTIWSWNNQNITIGNPNPSVFSLHPEKESKLSKIGCSKTDMPFSTTYSPSGFRRLLHSTPVKNGSLTQGVAPQPNNYIWTTDGKEHSADNLTTSSPEYKNATIKVKQTIDPTNLHGYLQGTAKASSIDIKGIQAALHNNTLLVV